MVSAVLNGRTERISCSETTRNKILDAARKLNYTPNALARSMREKKVPLVGVFLRQHPQTGGLPQRSFSISADMKRFLFRSPILKVS